MSKQYVVFGETACNTTDSQYTYANAVSFAIMDELGEDARFLDCTQADIINLALVVLDGFVNPETRNKCSKMLHGFVEDYEEFKKFAIFMMNTCRRNNVEYNSIIHETIEKETLK